MCDDREDGYVSKYLTHFVGRGLKPGLAFGLLCKVVRSGKLLPGGSERNWTGNVRIRVDKALSDNEMFLPECVCFCDIPLKMLGIHTGKYSQFGLAFDKVWLAQKHGASPVFYLARRSCCTDHHFPNDHPRRETTREQFFDLAAHDWVRQYMASAAQPENLSRHDNMFFWYILSYCKFFDENLPENHSENCYMEREWRTIGQVQFGSDNIGKIVLPAGFKEKLLKEFPDEPGLGEKVYELEATPSANQ